MKPRDRIAKALELFDLVVEIREEFSPGDPDRIRSLRRIHALTRRARKLLEGVLRSTRCTERDRAEAGQIMGALDDMKASRYPARFIAGERG